MAFRDDFYIINSTSYIAEVKQTLCTEFLKELKNDDDTLKPHVSDLNTNFTHYGKPAIRCILPTCFIEIEYKTSDGHYLIEHEVHLYNEHPTLKDLENYKTKFDFNFASQVEPEVYDIVDAFHQGFGCMCLSGY